MMTNSVEQLIHDLDFELSSATLNIEVIKHCTRNGAVDGCKNRRSLVWMILLNYLPSDGKTKSWSCLLSRYRKLYEEYIDEFVHINQSVEERQKNAINDSNSFDHPLNCDPKSKWSYFYNSNDVLLQIHKDVLRLCPDMSFFTQHTKFPCKTIEDGSDERLHTRLSDSVQQNSFTLERSGVGKTCLTPTSCKRDANGDVESGVRVSVELEEEKSLLVKRKERHWEVVERILFIYAQLNPGVGYVQGMNEIIGHLYFVFCSTPFSDEFQQFAEADTFFCFTQLMSEIRDNFINKDYTSNANGIQSAMQKLMDNLKIHDVDVYEKLMSQLIQPQYFSFRWLTVMFRHEFSIPDTLRIWDSIFASNCKKTFLLQFCLSMILSVKHVILKNDFAENMKLLQNYPDSMDVVELIRNAHNIKIS